MKLLIFHLGLCVLIPSETVQLDLLGTVGDVLGSTKPLTGLIIPEKENRHCEQSKTIVPSKLQICKGDLIFADDFTKPFLDRNLWDVEQYLPQVLGPDYEFNSYENSDDTYGIQNGKLTITPVVRKEEEIRGTLDLKESCTSKLEAECFYKQISSQIIPPVKSAKISTKFGFTYGRVEIKAKLPKGDWIYPQIQLVPRRKRPGMKIWIAYARGNKHYIGTNGDEGSQVMFGGVVTGPEEQERKRFTRRRPNLKPYGDEIHTYTLIWAPDLVTLLFNGEEYGKIPIDEEDDRFFPLKREFYLTLGVGVGGINDFPDNYTSDVRKPWMNFEAKQMKLFFDDRNVWLPTWSGRKSTMEIESVKIYAL